MKTHFNLSPEEYEAKRSGHLQDRRQSVVEAQLAHHPSALRNVLELGCGTGSLLARLAERHPEVGFDGVDVDERMVEYAQNHHVRPNVRFTLGDAASLSGDVRFDVVYSIDVIHHFDRHLDEFRAVRRVLRGAGAWIAIEPNIWHPYVSLQQERMRRAGYDEDHLRPWVIEPLMREAGFSIASRTYLHLLPGNVRTVPIWLETLERRLERSRFVGGSVVYTLQPQ